MHNLPGFAPINFRGVGKILLFVGTLAVVVWGIGHLTGITLSNFILYLGAASILLSLYIFVFVPKN